MIFPLYLILKNATPNVNFIHYAICHLVMINLQGKISRIIYQNQENGYTVARLETSKKQYIITGLLPDIRVGQILEASARQIEHPKFGLQWEIKQYKVILPQNHDGIEGYLSSGLIRGIGKHMARRIVTLLGTNTLDIIQNQPELLLSVPGIGKKTAARITEAVRSHGELREFMVFLQEHGVSVGTSLRVWRHYGPGSLKILKTEPHRLAQDIHGIGFLTADRIARQIGLASTHPSRIQAGLWHVLLQSQEEGNTFFPRRLLIEDSAKLLEVEKPAILDGLEEMLRNKILAQEYDHPDEPVYQPAIQFMEDKIAKNIFNIRLLPGILDRKRISKAVAWSSKKLDLKLSASQSQALSDLLGAGLGVLSGGPGTGKTTLVRAIIAISEYIGLNFALAAPTGRAAKRLGESCGFEASTLHRLLEYKNGRFLRNRKRPLPVDLVIIDESSMLDTWLMYHLSDALAPDTRLLLVGDVAQLPSIGPGMILQQIIDSGAAVVAFLREIFRQKEAGLIVNNAHRVLHGQMPEITNCKDSDFFFFHNSDPTQAAQFLVELVAKRLPKAMEIDPNEDIQVLAPMRKGILGCTNLNILLRRAINPSPSTEDVSVLQKGDKVIQMRNNYDLEVFNGDIGFVQDKHDDHWLIKMGDKILRYDQYQIADLDLAYAITIHKSQGSEYPIVVVVMAQEHYILLNRSLLYTALTRGRKMVILTGHPLAVKKAVNNQESKWRHTGLKWRINKLLS
ncbi:MAG: ATP-dependent RecD-like DNA helicase [Desulfarculales bacterium]|jgi:exodeoxyribonuclease V alpha subunit|nr:ATP-dependent RecD-like DNA helicase [Desulfarculales bacterium]